MKTVLIWIGAPLGDCIAAMPYINKYSIESGNDVYVFLSTRYFEQFFTKSFPSLKFCDGSGTFNERINLYPNFAKPLQGDLANQLGFDPAPYLHPFVDKVNGERPIKNRYAVIGLHSTAQLKYWNHPDGQHVQQDSPNWNELSDKLRKSGITPVVVEMDELFGVPPYYNGMPTKAQKKLGTSLVEAANLIEHAEFFIGLSSGLSWFAHGLGQKVAMIANFSEDWYEFDINASDYIRITNTNVCHGCWNRVGIDFDFDKSDWYWCPRHKDTPRQFECHTSITVDMVFDAIKKWI